MVSKVTNSLIQNIWSNDYWVCAASVWALFIKKESGWCVELALHAGESIGFPRDSGTIMRGGRY